MIAPLILLTAAVLAEAVNAFGADPGWAQFRHGVEFIMLSRRMQWPLVGVALLACVSVIAMVVGGRWRAWWLLGLAPVLALFAHRFSIDPGRTMRITDEAAFVAADHAGFVADDDYVVGLSFGGECYAYPYNVLYQSPVVVQAEREQRLLLIWSAFANRAVASPVDRTVKPRELEIVSVPCNALLVYNSRLGQFINGVTGLTMDGRRPGGFGAPVPTAKMPWSVWKGLHPRTLVMKPPAGWEPGMPTRPVLPHYPMPKAVTPGRASPPGTTVALVAAVQPAVVQETSVDSRPLNLLVGTDPILMFRDGNGVIRAFVRQANGDLTPRFFPAPAGKTPGGVLTERDSKTVWAADGRAVEGPLKGEKLKPVEVDNDVYLDVVRYWYPNLATITPSSKDVGEAPVENIPFAARVRNVSHARRPGRKSRAAAGLMAAVTP